MRPDPNELIDGIRDVLRETIAPELGNGPAVAALRRIMVILKETDWNEAAFMVADENRLLTALLREARQWVATSGRHNDPDLALHLSAEPADDAPTSFRAIADRNVALRETLATFISAVSRDRAADGADVLRSRMAAALARPAGRSQAGSREKRS